MPEVDNAYDDAEVAPEVAGREELDDVESETPCFDALFARYNSGGNGSFGTEHLGSLLLDMGFSCAPRVLNHALDDMDPNATGEIAKLTFLEWFEAHADEIDLPPSPGRSPTKGSPSSPRRQGEGREQAGDDGELTQATNDMLEAKSDRRRAEADVQVLANRLVHLRTEEAKAQKRIDEANRRAKEIEAVKRRNAEHARAKQRAYVEWQAEIQRTHDFNQLAVATSRERKHQHMSAISAMRSQIVQETRAERASHLQRIHERRHADHRELSEKSREIRAHEKLALHKRDATRRQNEKDLLRAAREQLAAEHARRLRNEKLIQQMEKEETALIETLRVTHEMQRAAYEHLEFVIHENDD